jgi:hypothetical protein
VRQVFDPMNTERTLLLQKYHLSPDMRLSGGMEADVYPYGADSILKVYGGTASFGDLLILRDFYHSLERSLVPYALPRIERVVEEGSFVVTIEQRLSGIPLAGVLADLSREQMDGVLQRYLDAALALSAIPAPQAIDRYKLFDSQGLSAVGNGDWHAFLANYLHKQLVQVGPYLLRDVAGFAEKLDRLRSILAGPYLGEYRLIHGDFFPGNLLVNGQLEVTALLDFGLLTMYGDPFFDLATAWVFFDMYDQLHARLRERCLTMLLERIGRHARGKLYRYVLIYSILAANAYSPTCADGHYQWCAANLNREEYWEGIA